ncbi:hypothetical protein ADEAN_000628000 [Angomonas deanei]|uniref:Uncharacterized protein n=1 Tax=Angomonas deanei TaxID=59799 RepID=A0A7G2CIB4_9TRYP|nr:hypothetical protein ADEAN_000628000 [Angomonas deanei]
MQVDLTSESENTTIYNNSHIINTIHRYTPTGVQATLHPNQNNNNNNEYMSMHLSGVRDIREDDEGNIIVVIANYPLLVEEEDNKDTSNNEKDASRIMNFSLKEDFIVARLYTHDCPCPPSLLSRNRSTIASPQNFFLSEEKYNTICRWVASMDAHHREDVMDYYSNHNHHSNNPDHPHNNNNNNNETPFLPVSSNNNLFSSPSTNPHTNPISDDFRFVSPEVTQAIQFFRQLSQTAVPSTNKGTPQNSQNRRMVSNVTDQTLNGMCSYEDGSSQPQPSQTNQDSSHHRNRNSHQNSNNHHNTVNEDGNKNNNDNNNDFYKSIL